jgi:hypothetical protein
VLAEARATITILAIGFTTPVLAKTITTAEVSKPMSTFTKLDGFYRCR